MGRLASTVRGSRHKRSWVPGAAAVVVIALAVLLGGCVAISNVDLTSGLDAGSNHRITMRITATFDSNDPVRGVVAVRVPVAWDVKSVTFTGDFTGTATRSTIMEGVYASTWEATTGPGHNGHKDGYHWWVGYTPAGTWAKDDKSNVAFLIDTHGRGGSYLLDFAFGIADAADPEDAAKDSGYWQLGSAGASPTGVLLDQAITLSAFTDVHPGANYYDAIQGMAAKGLIGGYATVGGYSEFRPTNSVFRAQFAKMIDGALGFTVDEAMAAPINFTDLGSDDPASLYPHEYAWVAYSNNIIKGYSDGIFRPYAAISRGQVVTMTVRALLARSPSLLTLPPEGYVQSWGKDLPPEHRENARIAEYNHLLAGLPLTTTASNANAPMPRGEVAQVLWNMMGLIAGP